MSNHNCPLVSSRYRHADVAKVAQAIVTDCVSDNPTLTSFGREGGDPLLGWIDGAMGTGVRINWSDLTDEEVVAVKAWHDYTVDVYHEALVYIDNTVKRWRL